MPTYSYLMPAHVKVNALYQHQGLPLIAPSASRDARASRMANDQAIKTQPRSLSLSKSCDYLCLVGQDANVVVNRFLMRTDLSLVETLLFKNATPGALKVRFA